MGNTYFETPTNFNQSVLYYRKALAMDSTLGYVYYNLGKLFQLSGQAEDSAYYYYGRACFYNPYRFRNMIHPIAEFYNRLMRNEAAKLYYRLAIRYSKSTRNLDLEGLIGILIGEKAFAEAKTTLDATLDPNADKVLYTKLARLIAEGPGKD